jgi:hypothetical protein
MSGFNHMDDEKQKRWFSGYNLTLLSLLGSVIVMGVLFLLFPGTHFFFLFLILPLGPLLFRLSRSNKKD